MLTFVVMPCLNEAALIANTIASLGFSRTCEAPEDCHLIVVDNGSSDHTPDILKGLRESLPNRIHLFAEPERGYVPPRRRGVAEAAVMARAMHSAPEAVLILQADADTTYRRGYITAIRNAAAMAGSGIMLEGATCHPAAFEAEHPSYVAAERLVDASIEHLDAIDEDEVVVDDKVCGYRLSDYLKWGGLFQEITRAGEPIHAETTRMFIRAKAMHGARKVRVNPAGAASSRRKVTENPWLHYATSGFPREDAWVREKCRSHGMSTRGDVDAFAGRVLHALEPEATYLRRAHQLALFRYLPAIITQALSGPPASGWPKDVASVMEATSTASSQDLSQSPGAFIFNLLRVIDTNPNLFNDDPS